MLGCFNTEWKTLTWLRYTVWMPLYPLGVLAEGRLFFLNTIWYKKHANMFIDSIIYTLISQSHVALAVIQSIPIFDESKLFSIPLTKVIGTSVSFSYFLYIYLVLMFLGKSPHELSLTWHIYSNLTTAALILILVPPPPPQKDFLSTLATFTSRGRGASGPKRGKQIETQHQQHSLNTFAACLFLDLCF